MSCEKDERDINEVDDDDDVQIRANYAKKTHSTSTTTTTTSARHYNVDPRVQNIIIYIENLYIY